MRDEGRGYITSAKAEWLKGSGEQTTLSDESIDWITVGSAFHWMDLEVTLKEFHRILKPGGFFTAIWNPRNIVGDKLHEEIEDVIYKKAPFIERKSSGSGKSTQDLDLKIISTGQFADVLYVEAKHTEIMTKERYMGIWDSVNDIAAQTGPELWNEIIEKIKDIIKPYDKIAVPYKTRSWTARKK